jgi:hypothetical protein
MTITKHKALGSGRIVGFNTSATEAALLEDISKDEMHRLIAEFEQRRIEAYWRDTMTAQSKHGPYLQAFAYGQDGPVYYKAGYLQAMGEVTLRGRALTEHFQTLPLPEQLALVEQHKPTSLAHLRDVVLHVPAVIAVDFHVALDEFHSVEAFVQSLLTVPASGDAPVYHPNRYVELLTVLWGKGLMLFPQSLADWPTPVKWVTLTDPQYGGERSKLVSAVCARPKKRAADPAYGCVCTFFGTSDVALLEDLSPALIKAHEEIWVAAVERKYPQEQRGTKVFSSMRGKVRTAALLLLQSFNYANPAHAVELTRPKRNDVRDEDRRVDGNFRWLVAARPEFEVWAQYFKAYIASLTTLRLLNFIGRLNTLGDYLCSLDTPPRNPWDVVRSKHIYDASLQNQNTLTTYLRKNLRTPRHQNDTLGTIRRFFDWLHDRLIAEGASQAGSFKNPILTSDSTGKSSIPSQTHRDALPPYVMREMKELLVENDFAFSRAYKSSHVRVLDNETGQSVWQFDPSLTACMYTLFDTPIRSHQARWLDSGAFDEYRYDFSLKRDVPNPSPLAVRGRREGVLRVQKAGQSSADWLGLWVNTNKTAKYGADVVGYLIPYVSETHARLLGNIVAWQQRYLPELKKLVPYEEYRDEVNELPRPADVKQHPIAPLFRDSSTPNQARPIKYSRLKSFYTLVLKETEDRILRKYGQKLCLVTTDGRGRLKWVVDLHTLRVSGLTNLIEAGVPLEVVSQYFAGHATLVMTVHYLKYSTAKLKKYLEDARARMDADQDFVGSELFIESVDELSPFLLGQEGAGTGAGFHALKDKTGILTINPDGICPGTSCSTGGAPDYPGSQKFGPVPGGQRCGLCRYWLTGPAHLLGQVVAVNNLAYTIRKKGIEVANLNDERLDAEDQGNQRKARGLRDRVDLLNRELEIDVNEWVARYKYAEQSLALMDSYLAAKNKVRGSGENTPVPILTAGSAMELKVTLEEAHEFALLDQITQMSEFTTGFKNREAELEKNTVLSRMMMANGMKPFLLGLSEEQAHEAGNLLSSLLLQQVRTQDLDEVLAGKKPLGSYPRLMSALQVLEANASTESAGDKTAIEAVDALLKEGDIPSQGDLGKARTA